MFFCLNLSFFDSVCQQDLNRVPENRDKKNEAARNAYATPAGAQKKLFYKLSAHGNVDVVLPNSCAGNHVRKGFSTTAPKSDARAAEMSAVRTVVRQVLSDFKFGTDMCCVTRTVLVDPARRLDRFGGLDIRRYEQFVAHEAGQ